MKIKYLSFIAISATIIAASSSAHAKYVSPSTGFKSSILSEKSEKFGDAYKACPSKMLSASDDKIATDYDSAIAKDPLEGFNRTMHSFNNVLDKALVKPTTKAYRFAVPQWGRDRVSDAFQNLEEPRNFVNSVLQLDGKSAFTSFWRFAINSTFGVLGLNDVASSFGLKLHEKDFSSTLAHYGVGSGPYLVVPVMGPSTVRDFVAMAPDVVTEPTTYADAGVSISVKAVNGINKRDQILDVTEDLERDSFDLYSSYKSGYLQNRKKQVQKSLARE